MAHTIQWKIAELERIAGRKCSCAKDNDVDDVCRVCVASRALNRMAADAYDTLEELEP